jgi:MFS family permease
VWGVVGGLLLVALLGSLDQSVVSTALPTIVGDLGGAAQLSAVVTAYLVASTVATPIWGRLGDRRGRKRWMLIAIGIFIGGSALCGLSGSMTELIAFRAVQGLGGGGLVVGAQAVVGDLVTVRERAKYLSLFSAVFAVISVLGPLIGGLVTDQLGWRWIFYLNLPISALAVVILGLALPRTGAASGPAVGPASRGWLRNRTFLVCALIGFVSGFVILGITIYLPLFFQVVRGLSPTVSGLWLLPLMISGLVTGLTSGFLIARRGRYKAFPLVGSAMATIGLFLLSLVGPDTPMVLVQSCLVVIGVGLGCIGEVLITVGQDSVPPGKIGTATATLNVFRSVGGVLGTALFGAVFAYVLGGRLRAGLRGLAVPPGLGTEVTPARLARLAPAVQQAVSEAYGSAIQTLLLIAAPLYAVVCALIVLLPEFSPDRVGRGAG